MISLILSAFSAVLCASYFCATTQLPEPFLGDPLGPRAFPYMLTAGLAICTVLLAIEGIRSVRSGRAADVARDPNTDLKLTALVVGWIFVYFLLFKPLGFIVATALFLAIALSFANRGKWLTNCLVSVLLPVVIFALMRGVLQLPLPTGIIPLG